MQVNAAEVNPFDIQIRPATAADEAFLRSVMEEGRAWEFSPLKGSIDDHQFDTLMKQQYESQHTVYFEQYDLANYGVIMWCGVPIGRLYVDFRDHEIRILDFMLKAAFRGKGIGTIILRGICREASQRLVPVTLSVHPLNGARAFYARHGFRDAPVQTGAFREMAWTPADPKARN